MKENFELLLPRIIDTLSVSNLKKIKEQLNSIKGNTVIISVGGSSVVAEFAKKTLNTDGINICKSPRDLNYEDLSKYKNILAISYSGRGYIIDSLKKMKQNKYLLTNGDYQYDNIEKIHYDTSITKETADTSFISLASTLMPISILYYYYNSIRLPEFIFDIKKMFNKILQDIENNNFSIGCNNVYEIMSGTEYSSAMKYLETTMVESGISIPIVHDKYDYCHGRSTVSYKNNNGLIYFDSNKELDKLMLKELKKYYTEIIKIEKYKNNNITNDYYAIIKSMYLTKMLASNKHKDLSKVNHSPLVYKLYNYRGEM